MCGQACRAVTMAWADGGYADKLVTWAHANLKLTVEIVKRNTAHVFVVLHRRWAVERTFAWITRSRRTVRDCERLSEHHAAMVYWSMIMMTRRLAHQQDGTGHSPPAMQQASLQAA